MSNVTTHSGGFLGRIGSVAFVGLCVTGSLLGGFVGLVLGAVIDAIVHPGSKDVPAYIYLLLLIGLIVPVVALIAKRRSVRRPLGNIEPSAATPLSSNENHSETVPLAQTDSSKRRNLIAAAGITLLCLVWKPIYAFLALIVFVSLLWKGQTPASGFLSSLSSKGVRIFAISVLSVVVVAFVAQDSTDVGSPDLPECDSATAKDSLKRAIEDHPTSHGRVRVFSAKNVRQCGVKEDASQELDIRACSATVFTNVGELPSEFQIKWIDRPKGEWFLQTTSCPLFGVIDGDLGWKRTPTLKGVGGHGANPSR